MSTSWATAARDVPGLDHDPCPGDVPATHRLATDLGARAHAVRAAATAGAGWDSTGWRGDGSVAAVAAVQELVGRLGPLARSLDDAGDVLRGWAVELAGLQDEAAALGAEAQETTRRHLQATLAAGPFTTPADAEADRSRLEAEREALRRRVEALHGRWLAAARRRSGELDATAPGGPADRWRGAWDLGHDRYQDQVRHQARWMGWVATGTGAASSVTGLAAPLTGPFAPAVGLVSVGLGATALQLQTQLAVGADAAAADVGGAAAGLAGGTLLGAAATGAVRYGPRAVSVVEAGSAVHDAHAVASAVQERLDGRGDGEAPGAVAGLDGGAVAVTVHDVASPWHVGHGLTGDGFVGVAVVPVVPGAAGAIGAAGGATTARPAAPGPTGTRGSGRASTPAEGPARDRAEARSR